jgi:hypothetical protein
MEYDEAESLEIIRLTEKFIEAIKDSDKKAVEEIAAADLKIEFKTLAGGFIEDFDKNEPAKIHIIIRTSEDVPQIRMRQNEAQVFYERNSHCHFAESDFQNGFIRQVYSYKKTENNWRLTYLKTEVRRFSGYNLKHSFLGLMECLIIKVMRRKWIIKA